jgi:hypothetical protein
LLRRIGFFHFVDGHADPIAALQAQLAITDCSHSLLVLPEAFNLGLQYSESGPCAFTRDAIIRNLQGIAAQSDITFVVGLLDTPAPGGLLPYSSAYAIDGTECRAICRKELPDGQAGRHYRTCTVNYDIENPVHFKNACIMAMICMDIQNSPRCTALTRVTEKAQESLRLICIPSAMSFSGWLYGSRCGEYINFTPPPHAHNTRIILANGDKRGPCSFITDTDWKTVACVPRDEKHLNRIMLSPIPEP